MELGASQGLVLVSARNVVTECTAALEFTNDIRVFLKMSF